MSLDYCPRTPSGTLDLTATERQADPATPPTASRVQIDCHTFRSTTPNPTQRNCLVLRSHFYHPRRLRTLNDVVGCVSAEIAGNTAPVEVFV